MPTPRPPWTPNGSTAAEERTRASALTVPQLRVEHMDMFAAHLNMLARVADAASGTRRHTWALNIKRLRILGRAMAVAIDSGDMDDRFTAKGEWDKPCRGVPVMFKNAGQEHANVERWSKRTLVDEHMNLWYAFKQSRAKKNAAQAGGKMLGWATAIREARRLANAMRDAIDTGDMAARMKARAEWLASPIDARDD